LLGLPLTESVQCNTSLKLCIPVCHLWPAHTEQWLVGQAHMRVFGTVECRFKVMQCRGTDWEQQGPSPRCPAGASAAPLPRPGTPSSNHQQPPSTMEPTAGKPQTTPRLLSLSPNTQTHAQAQQHAYAHPNKTLRMLWQPCQQHVVFVTARPGPAVGAAAAPVKTCFAASNDRLELAHMPDQSPVHMKQPCQLCLPLTGPAGAAQLLICFTTHQHARPL
jgi:hypothetical protein